MTDGEEVVVAEGRREVPDDVGDVRLGHMSAGGRLSRSSFITVCERVQFTLFRSREST